MNTVPANILNEDTENRGHALVVDDKPANCKMLGAMLQRLGFEVDIAVNGQDALALFDRHAFDIVFMDIMMPEMNGYQIANQIKKRCGSRFVPIIFLTALRNDDALARCIDAGGDDFMSKPFSFVILEARIRSMERIRQMYEELSGKNRLIENLLNVTRDGERLADRIFTRLVHEHSTPIAALRILQRPAEAFCGDLVLTARLPDGNVRILVADFTGHGMTAAVGALPVATLFRSMCEQGLSDAALLAAINDRLYELLPVDLFMAACLVTVDVKNNFFTFWNGGLPDALLLDHGITTALESRHLPLGIQAELNARPEQYEFELSDRLLIRSDGLHEATDRNGRMLGEANLVEVISRCESGQSPLDGISALLDRHLDGHQPEDDITLVDIPLGRLAEIIEERPVTQTAVNHWQWSAEWCGEQLAVVPRFSELLTGLAPGSQLEPHITTLETILTELYNNALDHGVLVLDSSIKDEPSGFCQYYEEREALLDQAAMLPGWVRLNLQCYYTENGGKLTIHVQDSGIGFIARDWTPPEDRSRRWGRGIALITELADSVTYSECGTEVKVLYRF
ncbi:MAG: ATP-binding SpoIIE family protein phosphatase [Pseudomonadota bacterium]